MILLLVVPSAGCLTTKLDGFSELVEANPQGFEDAVNGSYCRDESDHSERFMRSMSKYINELEYRLEKGGN